MGFALNAHLDHVRIDEPELLELYRSANQTVPQEAGCGRPCEAFICSAKKEDGVSVYVSLLDTVTHSTLVFTPDEDRIAPSDYGRLLREAKHFLKHLGFSMEKVRTDFSPGLRQVIIRDLGITRPPQPSHRKGVAAPAAQPAAQAPEAMVAQVLPRQNDGETSRLREELSAIRRRLEDAEREASRSRSNAADAAAAIERIAAEADLLRQQAAAWEQEREQFLDLLAARERSAAQEKEEKEALVAARTEAEVKQDELAAAIAALREAEGRLNEERESAHLKIRQLEESRAALAEEAEALRHEASALEEEHQRMAQDLLDAVNAAHAASSAAEDLQRQLAAVQGDLAESVAERFVIEARLKEGVKRRDGKETARLREEVERLNEALELERREKFEAAAERARFEHLLEQERRSFDRRRGEHDDYIHRLLRDLHDATEALEQLKSRSPAAPLSRQPEPAPAAVEPVAPQVTFREKGAPVPDQRVRYGCSDQIEALYESVNRLNLVPFGDGIRKCAAWICVVKDHGNRIVHRLWYLPDDDRVVQQSTAPADGDQELQAALFYFETTGFIMEQVDLGTKKSKREQVLKKVPVIVKA